MSEPISSGAVSRRHDLDALRAIAMLLGILLHVALSFAEPSIWMIRDESRHIGYSLFNDIIHGFRMPLFFLLSGFFTAMLWQKRGLRSLLWHRFMRIAVPLMICVVTIIPLQWGVTIGAVWTSMNQHAERVAELSADSPLWDEIAAGNLAYVDEYIESGQSLQITQPGAGGGPLTVAAWYGHPDIVNRLLDAGVDVNQADIEQSIPLHAAAFLGRAEIVTILLDHGADIMRTNNYQQMPLDSTTVDWEHVEPIIAISNLSLTQEEVEAGRERVQEILLDHGAINTLDIGIFGILQFFPFFHHLWFLWFLCWLIAGFAIVAVVIDKAGLRMPLQSWVVQPTRYLWLIPLSCIPYAWMSFPIYGVDTSLGIIPLFYMLFFYGIFFGFGALYYSSNDDAGRLGRGYLFTIPVSLIVLFPLGYAFQFNVWEIRDAFPEASADLINNVLQVSYTWLMTFGLIGVFRTYCAGHSPWIRYISDSSYWLYILHLPLVILAQMLVMDWPAPSLLKFVLINVVIIGFLLLTYEWMVRYTFIGRLLNGPRTRPQKATPGEVTP